MDTQTLQFYSENSAELAERYDTCSGGISDHFDAAFASGSRILDVGCGSGRDLRVLRAMGYQTDGVDPCEEFVNRINMAFNRSPTTSALEHSRTSALLDSLPELSTIADDAYDGVLCSAVLMHLPEEELFDASFAIRRVLKSKGRLLLSIPMRDETIDATTNRDPDGRLFTGVTPEELQLLFERIGFRLLNRWDSPDALNREHRKWATMLFELESATGNRPIDTIESILNKDAKVATYKLALFRAFANIATTNYKLAKWTHDKRVKIPTQVLAEKWIEYYWPIIESSKNIPQTTGTPIAFRKQLTEIIEYYRNRGGLSAFFLDYRNKQLSNEAEKLCAKLISKIKGTIWKQPVRYAGGGDDFSVLQYDKSDKTILIGSDIWKELSLMGSWIQDATILRWAEVTANIAKQEIKASEVIDCLLTVPIQEREVNAAKSFYDALKNKECVWSGKTINDKYNLDHAIPFSLWKNNDLWNLLPADTKVNANKRDRLPANRVVKARKECIVHYWSLINREFPARFEYEACKLIGNRSFDNANWENRLFATFAEAVEITAIQRGVGRWEPTSLAATGTENRYVRDDLDIVPMPMAMDAGTEYNAVKSKIIKIVSGGQTGADRGGLDAAIAVGIPHGGWCPKGRLAEDGVISNRYDLTECGSKSYLRRTELNVKDSDATVIFTPGAPTGGSKKTAEFADKHGKPCFILDTLGYRAALVEQVVGWLREVSLNQTAEPSLFLVEDPGLVLNVAGSRGSKAPSLQKFVKEIMIDVIKEVNGISDDPSEFAISEEPAEFSESSDFTSLPFYPNLEIACGAFRDGSAEFAVETTDVPDPHGNLDPKRHFVVRASGDSMNGGNAPIHDGDLLVLELNKGGTISNQIFAVEYQDEFGETAYVLKRIEKLSDGSYILVSANREYKPIPVDPSTMFPFARLKSILTQEIGIK